MKQKTVMKCPRRSHLRLVLLMHFLGCSSLRRLRLTQSAYHIVCLSLYFCWGRCCGDRRGGEKGLIDIMTHDHIRAVLLNYIPECPCRFRIIKHLADLTKLTKDPSTVPISTIPPELFHIKHLRRMLKNSLRRLLLATPLTVRAFTFGTNII